MNLAEAPFRVQMSKGVHLLVPRERIRLNTGLITRTEKSVLFVIPWSRYWIIGTTDTPWTFDRSRPTATRADIDYLLDHVNDWLADRVMAADVVTADARGLGRAVAPSLTKHLPILGAVGYHELWADRHTLAARAGLPLSTVEHLLNRYGSASTDLLTMIDRDRTLANPLTATDGYLAAEAVYAVTHEGALDLDDVLSRRTRISIEYPDRGLAAVDQVADLVAPHLDWDLDARQAAIESYRDQTRAELAARNAPNDAAATETCAV